MKIPKRIKKFIEKKDQLIDDSRGKIEQHVIRSQNELLNQIISDVVIDFEVSEGKIVDSPRNYRMLADLDKLYNIWNKSFATVTTKKVVEAINKLTEINVDYFAGVFSKDFPARFDKIVSETSKITDLRLGLDGGKMVRGGYLESIFKDGSVITEVKQYFAKGISGQITKREFVKGLTNLITGVPKEVMIEGKKELVQIGAYERKFRQTVFDVYQQYDRAYSDSLAKEFELNYFIYMGGKVDDSRDFCVAHDGKVWSREETEKFKTWVPADGEYPAGYDIQAKNLHEHPGYMDYPGYSPLTDLGGYNCRHHASWIDDNLAFEMRPELKKEK